MTTDDSLTAVLGEIGLSEPEARVYLASLAAGPQPASVLAKRAGLKRGHTYNLLALLAGKGIFQEFLREGVRTFAGQPPRALLNLVESRRSNLEVQEERLLQALPALERLKNPLLAQPKVRYFQGIDGIKEMYEDTLRDAATTIYALADFDLVFSEKAGGNEFAWIWKYAQRRARKGIRYRGIVNRSARSDAAFRKRKEHLRALKMLENTHLPVEINVYGDKVALMSTHAETVGVLIEDAPIAETLRNLHRAIWDLLPDYSLRTSRGKAK